MYVFAVVMLVVIFAVLTFLAVEVRKWTAGRRFISRRHFVLRVISGLVLLGLLTAIFIGVLILRLQSPAGRPALFLIYWITCLVVALALMILALQELKQVKLGELQGEHELWREVARLFVDQSRKKRD